MGLVRQGQFVNIMPLGKVEQHWLLELLFNIGTVDTCKLYIYLFFIYLMIILVSERKPCF